MMMTQPTTTRRSSAATLTNGRNRAIDSGGGPPRPPHIRRPLPSPQAPFGNKAVGHLTDLLIVLLVMSPAILLLLLR